MLAVLVAGGIGAMTFLRSDDPPGGSAAPTTAVSNDAVDVSSDAPTYRSLQELVDASDLIVRGRVSATARGRWFGGGDGGSRIESRLVTLEVDEILQGTPRGEAARLLVEEEGWTDDGRPLVIDGAVPTQEGDVGIWFLVDTGDETGAWIVVNAQGRYRTGPSPDGAAAAVVGARGGDALVEELSSGSLDDLADRISRTPPRP